jgi:hypothetical protein
MPDVVVPEEITNLITSCADPARALGALAVLTDGMERLQLSRSASDIATVEIDAALVYLHRLIQDSLGGKRALLAWLSMYQELVPPERIERAFGAEADALDRARYERLRTMPYGEYLVSTQWLMRREAKLAAASYRCQICNEPGELQVHHRTYERRGNEHDADLIVLCAVCHGLYHNRLPQPTGTQWWDEQ